MKAPILRCRARRALLRGAAGLALIAVAAAPVRAEPVMSVVELFTSQGCDPCRAAEPVMRELARKPGIIALTLPVTYWDYLGWADTMALSALNERQRAYSRAHGARQVLTPQVVVDGGATAIGSNRNAVDSLLLASDREGLLPVPVRAEIRGTQIVVEVGEAPGQPAREAARAAKGDGRDDVWLVPLLRRREIEVEAGENDGRVATYVNVVRGLHRLGTWTGQPVRFEVPVATAAVSEADGWVVLVQHVRDGRLGRILGAAKGPGL